MLEDVLLDVSTVVVVDIKGEKMQFLVIGKRQINEDTKRAWDYMGVCYPSGYDKRSGYGYFNHYDIHEVVSLPPEAKKMDDEEDEN